MPTLDFKGKSFVYTHHLSVPFRELVVDAKKSFAAVGRAGSPLPAASATKSGAHGVTRPTTPSLQDNLIIHGDNLHALKALLPVYAGKVDCIYIDPPYNTGNEGWCYNDAVRSPLMKEWLKKAANPVEKDDLERHEKWLCMMWPRLKLLHELLAEDGAIFISIDDNEMHRLRDCMDEIFGEENFVASVVWQKRISPESRVELGAAHDYILVYSKRADSLALRKLPVSSLQEANFKNPDKDPRGPWVSTDFTAQGYRPNQMYKVKTPGGAVYEPPPGRCWANIESEFKRLCNEGRMWFGADGKARPRVKTYLNETEGVSSWTWWAHEDVGSNQEAKKEILQILGSDNSFDYPKPKRLLSRILELASQKDSIILDSFAGSGTTAHAVLALNKKDGGNRKFILVETEDYADKLTAERVRRVIGGYKFEGTQREELMREPITLTALKKSAALLEKADSFELLDKHRFDRIVKSVEDGALVVTGEKKVTEKVAGLGGSFTFCTLGEEMDIGRLLTGDKLPSFDALAKYVFYTATGRTLEEVAQTSKSAVSRVSKPADRTTSDASPIGKSAIQQVGKPALRDDGFIGETELYRVHLFYKAEKKWLASNDAALTEQLVEKMQAGNKEKKRLLVFAAAKFMSQKELTRLGVEFCQLPYAIHRIMGD